MHKYNCSTKSSVTVFNIFFIYILKFICSNTEKFMRLFISMMEVNKVDELLSDFGRN